MAILWLSNLLSQSQNLKKGSSKNKARFASGWVQYFYSVALLALPGMLNDFVSIHKLFLGIFGLFAIGIIGCFKHSCLFNGFLLVSPVQAEAAGSSGLLGYFDATKGFVLLIHFLILLWS